MILVGARDHTKNNGLVGEKGGDSAGVRKGVVIEWERKEDTQGNGGPCVMFGVEYAKSLDKMHKRFLI